MVQAWPIVDENKCSPKRVIVQKINLNWEAGFCHCVLLVLTKWRYHILCYFHPTRNVYKYYILRDKAILFFPVPFCVHCNLFLGASGHWGFPRLLFYFLDYCSLRAQIKLARILSMSLFSPSDRHRSFAVWIPLANECHLGYFWTQI